MYSRINISKSTENYSRLIRMNKSKKHSEINIIRNNSHKNYDSKIKEKIRLEIINLIKENMNNIENKLSDISSINKSKTFEEDNFKNYLGEKISMFSNYQSNIDEESNENTLQKGDRKDHPIKSKIKSKKQFQLKTNLPKKHNQEKKNFDLKKLLSKINKNINGFNTENDEETLVNCSNFEWVKLSSLENDNEENEKEIQKVISTCDRTIEKKKNYKLNCYKTRTINIKDNINQPDKQKGKSYFQEGKLYFFNNPSFYDSTSTSNTNEKNKLKFQHSDAKYFYKNEIELIHFFDEINLPSYYAKKFIENGLDDLNNILNLTKTSLAITNKNLKDIGILNASHRAKILIHLEEKAEIIPYHLERDIIYNRNDSNSTNKIMGEKLSKFFDEINCEKYLNNFKLNGYFNIELLLTQMFIRQPINSEILKEDFYINDELCRNRIVNKLEIESKKYMKRLQKRNIYNKNTNNNTITFEDKKFHNPCENCLIF